VCSLKISLRSTRRLRKSSVITSRDSVAVKAVLRDSVHKVSVHRDSVLRVVASQAVASQAAVSNKLNKYIRFSKTLREVNAVSIDLFYSLIPSNFKEQKENDSIKIEKKQIVNSKC
jgi:hypothetical protein